MNHRIGDEPGSSPTLTEELAALTRELGLSTTLREELALLADDYRSLAALGPDRRGDDLVKPGVLKRDHPLSAQDDERAKYTKCSSRAHA